MTDYKALTGLNYPSEVDGKEVRVEVGGKISDMPQSAIENELEAGHIEPWSDDAEQETPPPEQGAPQDAAPTDEPQADAPPSEG